MSLITTRRPGRSTAKKMRHRPTRRRHSSSTPRTGCTSPLKGSIRISSRARPGILRSRVGARRNPCSARLVRSTTQVTLEVLPADDLATRGLLSADQDAPQLRWRERLVVERDVFGPSCASRRGETLGGGGAPDSHVRNSVGEEPVAFYHRVGKGRAARGGCQGDDRGPETPRATGLSAGPRRTAGHAAELSAVQVLPRLPREARSEGARKVAMLEEGAHIGVVSSQAAHRRMTTGEASAQHRPHQPRVPHQLSAGATP